MNIRLKKEEKIKVLCAEDLYGIMQRILVRESRIDRNREHLWTVSLDTAYRILNIELVSLGTVNKTLVEPMEVYSIPLQKRAVKVILVHNHPSGELKPSERDKDITDQLIQVGRIMNVPLKDHLIISETDYYSFLDSGLLNELEQSLKYVPAYEIKKRLEKMAKEIEKAEEKGKKEIARQMKKEGYAIEAIMKITGLSKAVITRLKAE
ncbi:JAB domain-containing protein [Taibaiella lutea]|uniref:JAB domain-containing protein n=1 Tax=Taibaiella lutea TaxID=2608001 RepID=A0A5M6CK52_9BACT|nr:JAB domain-containing protein [Taibaiella lutea]KAA5534810.1 JAB domain-containing protein [Taibaiella lutea]